MTEQKLIVSKSSCSSAPARLSSATSTQKVCTTELLEKHARVILEKEGSGCIALLQNDKSEDLSRMYRLFSKVPNGLAPMAALVRQHIEAMVILHLRFLGIDYGWDDKQRNRGMPSLTRGRQQSNPARKIPTVTHLSSRSYWPCTRNTRKWSLISSTATPCFRRP